MPVKAGAEEEADQHDGRAGRLRIDRGRLGGDGGFTQGGRAGVVRLDAVTGAFDPTFGYGGAVIKSGGPPESMIVHRNGKVVTGTFTPGATAPVPAVQRYLGS